MHTSELDYELPLELIAQHPVVPRDRSRLLVYDRKRGVLEHRRLPDLLTFLNAGDVLVYNDSRVLRARIYTVKPTGGRIELLFLKRLRAGVWEVLARPSSRLKEGMELDISDRSRLDGLSAEFPFQIRERLGAGRWLVKNRSSLGTEDILEKVGEMPLPPYIHEGLEDSERYQAIYASQPGSAAAPTAGLHFTPELLGRIREAGIGLLPLTLHIGLDTFRPVGENELELHEIHKEFYKMPLETYESIVEARKRGGCVVAVGTTAVRVLETVFASPRGQLEGETGIFITPGHRFTAVDAMLTNFHLPRSTLLALVMAFAGVKQIRWLYRNAVKEEYRFYSFGDAMLLI